MDEVEFFFASFQIFGPLGCQGWVVIPQNVKKSLITRGGQRYFFGGCAFARILPFFLRPLANLKFLWLHDYDSTILHSEDNCPVGCSDFDFFSHFEV